MKKIILGAVSGTILGLLDGLSALFIPEAANMLKEIIIGSTVKGLINGLIIGFIAQKITGMPKIILFGTIAGLILSIGAAVPTGAYAEIIIPGIVVSILCGFITSKWGK